jgi:hypothetical protein
VHAQPQARSAAAIRSSHPPGVGGVEAGHAGERAVALQQQTDVVMAHGEDRDALPETGAVGRGVGSGEHVESRHSGAFPFSGGLANGRVERGVVGAGEMGAGGLGLGGGDGEGTGMETADSLYAHLQGKLLAPAPLSLTINSHQLGKLSVTLSLNRVLPHPSPFCLGLCARYATRRQSVERLTKRGGGREREREREGWRKGGREREKRRRRRKRKRVADKRGRRGRESVCVCERER